MRIKLVILLAIVLMLALSVGAAPAPFISPVPWCGPDAVQPCLPWRPTPLAKEPKETPAINLELAARGACIAAARHFGVNEAACK